MILTIFERELGEVKKSGENQILKIFLKLLFKKILNIKKIKN